MAYSGYNQRPGFVARKAGTPFKAPSLQAFNPAKPTGPIAERGMRAGAQATEQDLLTRGAKISEKYAPQRTAATSSARARLKGFGGYKVNDDGSIGQSDPNAQPGDYYKDAYRQGTSNAAAAGMMDSSFAAKSIGAAFGRLSAEAQAVVTQHAATMNGLVQQEAQDFSEINSQLIQLYGNEAEWLIDNPPPVPEPAPEAAPPPNPDPEQAAAAAGGGGNAAAGTANRMWKGERYGAKPNLNSLSRVWGIPANQIRVTRSGDGRWVAKPK